MPTVTWPTLNRKPTRQSWELRSLTQVHESPHLQSALDVHEQDVTLLWWTAIPLQRTTDAEGRYRSRRHRGDGRRGEQ